MTPEEKQDSYEIVYMLSIIEDRLQDLNNNLSVLKNNLDKNLIINSRGYKQDSIENLKTSVKNIIWNVNNDIYSINQRIDNE